MQDLNLNFAIVDRDGKPNQYFIRFLQDRGLGQEDIIKQIEILTDLVAGKADKTINLIAGVGLSGGGDLSADRTFDLENTAVTAGTYGDATNSAQITIDAQGRITNAVDVPIAGGGGGGGLWYFDPPFVSTFPTLITGDGTNLTMADDTQAGLLVRCGTTTGGDRIRGAFTNLASSGAASWTATIHLIPFNDHTGGQNSGGQLIALETATNKLINFGALYGYRSYGLRGTTTGFGAQIGVNKNGYNLQWWYRITYDHPTTTYTLWESADGKTWLPNGSIAATSAFTVRADKIGIGFTSSTASNTPVCCVDNWSLV